AVRLRRAYDSLRSDVIEVRNADDELRFEGIRTASQEALDEMIAQLDGAAESARRAEVGQIRSLHIAAAGDTWESMSRRHYGGPEKAASIREANGVTPGTQPIPGEVYVIPNR